MGVIEFQSSPTEIHLLKEDIFHDSPQALFAVNILDSAYITFQYFLKQITSRSLDKWEIELFLLLSGRSRLTYSCRRLTPGERYRRRWQLRRWPTLGCCFLLVACFARNIRQDLNVAMCHRCFGVRFAFRRFMQRGRKAKKLFVSLRIRVPRDDVDNKSRAKIRSWKGCAL